MPPIVAGASQGAAAVIGIGTWVNEVISTNVDVHWYKFTAVSGTTYDVLLNNFWGGDGTKTAKVYVSAFESDGTIIFHLIYASWTSPQSISGVTGTVYLKVSGNTGTYAIQVVTR